MPNTRHGKEFGPTFDTVGKFDSFIPNYAGDIQLKFSSGETATFKVNAGTQYNMRFDAIEASGTSMTGAAFY